MFQINCSAIEIGNKIGQIGAGIDQIGTEISQLEFEECFVNETSSLIEVYFSKTPMSFDEIRNITKFFHLFNVSIMHIDRHSKVTFMFPLNDFYEVISQQSKYFNLTENVLTV